MTPRDREALEDIRSVIDVRWVFQSLTSRHWSALMTCRML